MLYPTWGRKLLQGSPKHLLRYVPGTFGRKLTLLLAPMLHTPSKRRISSLSDKATQQFGNPAALFILSLLHGVLCAVPSRLQEHGAFL